MTPHAILQQFEPGAEIIGPWEQTGNINRSCHHIRLSDGEGILQRLNTDVFPNPEILMDNAVRWSSSQPVSVEFLRAEASYWVVTRNEHWRLMRKIEGGIGYFRLDQTPNPLKYAEELGRALAQAHHYAVTLDPTLFAISLPGFRDPHYYWREFQLARQNGWPDRLAETADSLSYLADRHAALTQIRDQILLGHIRQTVIHGDTKIENFLFDSSGSAIALVDLDTVMAGSWLMDWGDMMRSLTNPVGEKADPREVKFDSAVYQAARAGYLSVARAPAHEIALMEAATLGTTLEQALRFLSDYVRGDTYYRLSESDPPKLNLIRAVVQIELARQMEIAFAKPM